MVRMGMETVQQVALGHQGRKDFEDMGSHRMHQILLHDRNRKDLVVVRRYQELVEQWRLPKLGLELVQRWRQKRQWHEVRWRHVGRTLGQVQRLELVEEQTLGRGRTEQGRTLGQGVVRVVERPNNRLVLELGLVVGNMEVELVLGLVQVLKQLQRKCNQSARNCWGNRSFLVDRNCFLSRRVLGRS